MGNARSPPINGVGRGREEAWSGRAEETVGVGVDKNEWDPATVWARRVCDDAV